MLVSLLLRLPYDAVLATRRAGLWVRLGFNVINARGCLVARRQAAPD
jgi:hypothetical protein